MLPEFDLLKPNTLAEALDILAEGGADIHPVAGGTNLIVDMRAGYIRPSAVLNIAGLDELGGIRKENGHLYLGGAVTLTEIHESDLIAKYAPIMKQAAAAFANPLIRNRATVGGNLVNNAPCADTAPPLLVLNAEVELTRKNGVRYVPMEEFLIDAFKTVRQPNELLTAVRWPVSPPLSAGAFQKMGMRKVTCMAKVDVAVMIESYGDGGCQDVRIALGAVAAKHFRVHAAEDLLRGQPFAEGRFEEAARLTAEAAQPRAGSEYKRGVVQALTRRLLTKAVDEIGR